MANESGFCRAWPLKEHAAAGASTGEPMHEPSVEGLRGLKDSKKDELVPNERTHNPEPVRPEQTQAEEEDNKIQE